MKKLLVLLLATSSFTSNAFAAETIQTLEKRINDIYHYIESDPQAGEWEGALRPTRVKMRKIIDLNPELKKIKDSLISNYEKIYERRTALRKNLRTNSQIQAIQEKIEQLDKELTKKWKEAFAQSQNPSSTRIEKWYKDNKATLDKLYKLWGQKGKIERQIINNDTELKNEKGENVELWKEYDKKIEEIKKTNSEFKKLDTLFNKLHQKAWKRHKSLYTGEKQQLNTLYKQLDELYKKEFRKDTSKQQIQAKEKQEVVKQIVSGTRKQDKNQRLIGRTRSIMEPKRSR